MPLGLVTSVSTLLEAPYPRLSPFQGSKLWTQFVSDMILEGSILVTTSTSLLQGDLGRLPFTQYARELETCINSHNEGSDIESHYAACPSQWLTPINTKAFPVKSMTLKVTK